eukprot:967806-Rhodomonas_salina.2
MKSLAASAHIFCPCSVCWTRDIWKAYLCSQYMGCRPAQTRRMCADGTPYTHVGCTPKDCTLCCAKAMMGFRWRGQLSAGADSTLSSILLCSAAASAATCSTPSWRPSTDGSAPRAAPCSVGVTTTSSLSSRDLSIGMIPPTVAASGRAGCAMIPCPALSHSSRNWINSSPNLASSSTRSAPPQPNGENSSVWAGTPSAARSG